MKGLKQQLTCPGFPVTAESKHILKATFESALIFAVDECFSSLGQAVKQAIYQHLETAHGIRKEEIPFKIEAFISSLEETFGPAAKLVEIKIIEKLHKKAKSFKLYPVKPNLCLSEYLKNLYCYLKFWE